MNDFKIEPGVYTNTGYRTVRPLVLEDFDKAEWLLKQFSEDDWQVDQENPRRLPQALVDDWKNKLEDADLKQPGFFL